MAYIPWWQRMTPPTFAERFDLGGLAGRLGNKKPRLGYVALPLVINPYTIGLVATTLGIAGEAARRYINENPGIVEAAEQGVDKIKEFVSFKKKKEEPSKEIVKEEQTDWSGSFKDKEPKPPKDPLDPKWQKLLEIAEQETTYQASKRWTKKAVNALKKHFDNKAWTEKPIVTGNQVSGTRKSVIPGKNMWFYKGLNDYAKEKHGGNLKSAIRELSGETDSKKINSIYFSITQGGDRRGFIFETEGIGIESKIPVANKTYKLTELTTKLKENSALLDERIKTFDKNKVYNKKELIDILGIESGGKRSDNYLMQILKDNGAEWHPLPGGKKGMKLKDAFKAFKNFSGDKILNWESRITGDTNRKGTYTYRKKWDSGITNFARQLYKGMHKNLKNLKIGDTKLYLPNSTAEIGHNPIPLAYADQFDIFKNKKVRNKIFKLGNTTWQDKDINRGILMDEQGKLLKPLNIIEKYWGKKVNKNNIQELNNARVLLQNYFRDVSDDAKSAAEGTTYIKSNVIGDFIFTVPKIGETIGEGSISVDMSKVDPKYIIGNVDLINKDAIKYDDLSKDEKIMFGQNVIDQKIEQIKDFYTDAGYGMDIIEDIVEALLIGHVPGDSIDAKDTKGLLERKHFKATGGPVLSGVDQYIINRGI